MITVRNLIKYYGADLIFKDVSFTIKPKERIAIVGPNGAGKSTLLRMLADRDRDYDGSVEKFKNIKIGYLHQDYITNENNTVYEELYEVFTEIIDVGKQLKAITKKMETDYSDQILNKFARIEQKYQELGGYEVDYKIKNIFTQFGFNESDLDKYVSEFSGGEKFKISFSKLLITKPDVLLLDEPTNHLDIETIKWLENYLKSYEGTIVFISHDRVFIDKLATKIFEINLKRLTIYSGNYSKYLVDKEENLRLNYKEFREQQRKIKKMEDWITRNKAKASKVSMAKDRMKKLERLERVELLKDPKKDIKVDFNSTNRNLGTLVETMDLVCGYDKPILEDVNITIESNDKIAFIGRNGAGKSTLIKTILDVLEPMDGIIEVQEGIKIGYLDQHLNTFDDELTLFDALRENYPQLSNTKIRTMLGHYYFKDDDVFKKIKQLSGGEKIRFVFLKLVMDETDMLILDEPSNHLDIETKEIFAEALKNYYGTIVCISHDRHFLRNFTNKVFSINGQYIDVTKDTSII